ncbi:glutamate--cysteine ligase [Endothiovibrio diazotrophicus]
MGQEIDRSRFHEEDFRQFTERLREETALLERWIAEGAFADGGPVGGFELEAWLVDGEMRPAPIIEPFLKRLDDPLVVPELARFNVELNVPPQPLAGTALRRLEQALRATWMRCRDCAKALDASILMTGILPTLTPDHLTPANMSPLRRYRALNEQVFAQRRGRPLRLDIAGRHDHLATVHENVMLESATTSFQLHLQVPPAKAVRAYNAAILLSAPMVAVSANAPFLFGHELWEETRIPLFEQSVELGGFDDVARGPLRRVTFGSGYALESLAECFRENLEHYPLLLPVALDEPAERLPHLRLHNGTIWRWNRPLVGFDEGGPHLRIEHRVIPGGPSCMDEIANAALFFGLVADALEAEVPPELKLPFPKARENFYSAARLGLDAHITWLEGQRVSVRGLLAKQLVPLARRGLDRLGLDEMDIDHYLGIIERRLESGQNGAAWQRAWVARHGPDMAALTAAYAERQASGAPVHLWEV